MADINKSIEASQKNLAEASEKQLRLSKEIEQVEKRVNELHNAKRAKKKEELKDDITLLDTKKKQLEETKKIVTAEEQKINRLNKGKKIQDDTVSEFKSFGEAYRKMDPVVKKQLETNQHNAAVFKGINADIAKQKAIVANTEGEAKRLAEEKLTLLEGSADSMKEAAAEAAKAQQKAKGMDDNAIRIQQIKNNRTLTADEKKRQIAALHYTEQLKQKEERLEMLHEQQSEMLEEMPQSIQGMVNGMKKFGAILKANAPELLVLGMLAMAVESFIELDSAAEDYRKTGGMTVKQTEHLAHQAHEIEVAYRGIGVEASTVFDIANDLGNTFSDVAHFSTETLGSLSALVARTGTSTKNAAQLQAIFEQTAGVSSETAANMQMQVASLAQQAGVSPKEVLDDMADSAEVTSKFFKGDINLLKQQAIQAHRMGTSLEKMAKTAESLLDFENGIEEELTAATFVGGQFNLSRARALAMEGKMAEATSETLDQIQRSGDFRKQDYFTQQQLAKAAGMSIEDINKQLGMREKLSHLSEKDKKAAEEAMKQGLDISDIKAEDLAKKTQEFADQQKINGAVTEMANQFKGIAATLGGELMPIIQALVPVIQMAFKPIEWAIAGIKMFIDGLKQGKALAIGLSLLLLPMAVSAMVTAVGAIFTTLAQIPFGIGLLGAAAVIAGMFASGEKAKSVAHHAGDINSPAKGQTMVHTKEGGLFKLSKNDDLVAAPGASKAMANGNSSTPLTSNNNNGNSSNMMSAFISELRGLRGDMNSGKIGVYMDGSKVTSNVAGNANQSTRNNYAFT
jgi:hypothetical protein